MPDFSYQLYSSRNFPPLKATLAMLAGAGYRRVEGFGDLYADAAGVARLRAGLDASGLAMASGHFALAMVEQAPQRVLEIAAALGMEAAFVPYLAPGERPADSAGWHALGARLERAGAPLRAAGLTFGYHNHDFEFVPTPTGETPMDLLLDGGPALGWEIDVAWAARGGAAPRDLIAARADRIVAAHVKDIAPAGGNAGEDGWADVGDGVMDWPALLAALRRTACRHFVLEHDNPADDRRFARRSLAAVRAFARAAS